MAVCNICDRLNLSPEFMLEEDAQKMLASVEKDEEIRRSHGMYSHKKDRIYSHKLPCYKESPFYDHFNNAAERVIGELMIVCIG